MEAIWTWIIDHTWAIALIRAVLWILPLFLVMPLCIWLERRLLGWMQDRLGPNRVGPFGLLQPIADGAKLFFKEEIVPDAVDKLTYFIAPMVSLIPAITLGAIVPFAPAVGVYAQLTPVADVNIGVLFTLAMSSLGVYGLVLAGYSSNNKYSLMGGLRASAQLISYELAMSMALASVVLMSGSLKMTEIVKAQEQPLWGFKDTFLQNWNAFNPFGFVAMLIFLVCMVAETNRPPFDLPEAENELVAGYHTEYSSMKFATFYMGEYLAMLMFGTILASAFLGGYNFLPIDWDHLALSAPGIADFCHFMTRISADFGPVWLLSKAVGTVVGYIWLRATLPRLRYDQLMNLGWKSLLPAATFTFITVATWITATATYGFVIGWMVGLGIFAVGAAWYSIVSLKNRKSGGDKLPVRTIELVDPIPPIPRGNSTSAERELAAAGGSQ